MRDLLINPPHSEVEPVTEVLHGIYVTDCYRWLEDQDAPRTRQWIAAQQAYTRFLLDDLPQRAAIRSRVRQLLDITAYDSAQCIKGMYFFRRRLHGEQQYSICFRERFDGKDQVLVEPLNCGATPYTAVRIVCVSPDARFLCYEAKEGGERAGRFEFLEIEKRCVVAKLPRGFLRGVCFTPEGDGFYYVLEPTSKASPHRRCVAYQHVIGTTIDCDKEVFSVPNDGDVRLILVPGTRELGFLVVRRTDQVRTDFYLAALDRPCQPEAIIRDADFRFGPVLIPDGRLLAITDQGGGNARIAEVRRRKEAAVEFRDVVPAGENAIQDWTVVGDWIFASYFRNLRTEIDIFEVSGRFLGILPVSPDVSIRFASPSEGSGELLFECESFTRPPEIFSYSPRDREFTQWTSNTTLPALETFQHVQVWFSASDGMPIPMFLVGRKEVLEGGPCPTIMTAYGGYGVAMTPQFSVFVTCLMERGCLFALPNIRGGSEFGTAWHTAAKRRKRHIAIDDFLSAAAWLIDSGHTEQNRLAIFGGSNAGLLVAAAMTRRPELFRAVLCIAPLLDMVRYHHFDGARVWAEEFGTSDDPEDLSALLGYSPYHRVRESATYPATMIVSGDKDQNCNPMHARKMTALLQSAAQGGPFLLDYNVHRGHSPVLPLETRVDALTDRLSFISDLLQLSV